jgi:hypothetical protein
LAKANISVPAELQQVVSDILQNLEVPVAVQNQQQQQALEQQAQQQQQQMEQQQMEQQQPQEPQEQLQTA